MKKLLAGVGVFSVIYVWSLFLATLFTGCITIPVVPDTNAPPVVTNIPPVVPPIPATGIIKASMFFPWQMYGTTKNPVWAGNQGVDSLLGFALFHGNGWEDACRRNGLAWIQAMGGNACVWIADSQLYGNIELAMFLCNAKSPVDGHRIPDSENWVVIARKQYGIDRWVIALFNDDSTVLKMHNISNVRLKTARFLLNHYPVLKLSSHEAFIKEITGHYDWANAEQVVWLICLEANERFSVAQTIERVEWVKKYSPGHRIAVGSAQASFLKQVASAAKAKGLVVELWPETPWHPFQTTMANADQFLAIVKNLKDTTGMPVWVGEYGNGKDPSVAYISRKALEMGCVGIGSYNK